MSKLIKIILEYDNKIKWIKGKELDNWNEKIIALSIFAATHGQNPFDFEPTKWNVENK